MAKPVVVLLAVVLCGSFVAAALVVTRRARPADPATCGETCAVPTAPAAAAREGSRAAPALDDLESGLGVEETPTGGNPDASGSRTTVTGPYAEILNLPERDRSDIQAKVMAVQKALAEASGPLLEQRFADGRSTVVPEGKRPAVKGTDAGEIASVKTIPGQGTYRVALPRSEYPDLYQLRDAVVRLQRQLVRISNATTRDWEKAHPPKTK